MDEYGKFKNYFIEKDNENKILREELANLKKMVIQSSQGTVRKDKPENKELVEVKSDEFFNEFKPRMQTKNEFGKMRDLEMHRSNSETPEFKDSEIGKEKEEVSEKAAGVKKHTIGSSFEIKHDEGHTILSAATNSAKSTPSNKYDNNISPNSDVKENMGYGFLYSHRNINNEENNLVIDKLKHSNDKFKENFKLLINADKAEKTQKGGGKNSNNHTPTNVSNTSSININTSNRSIPLVSSYQTNPDSNIESFREKTNDDPFSQFSQLNSKLIRLEKINGELENNLKVKSKEFSNMKDVYERELKMKNSIYNQNITQLNNSNKEDCKKLRLEYELKLDEAIKRSEEEKMDLRNKISILENENFNLRAQLSNNFIEMSRASLELEKSKESRDSGDLSSTLTKEKEKENRDYKAYLVEFQKKYLNEMKMLQTSFENFKTKTYEDLKNLKKQRDEARDKADHYKDLLKKTREEYDKNELHFKKKEKQLREKFDDIREIQTNYESLKSQIEDSKKQIAYFKNKVKNMEERQSSRNYDLSQSNINSSNNEFQSMPSNNVPPKHIRRASDIVNYETPNSRMKETSVRGSEQTASKGLSRKGSKGVFTNNQIQKKEITLDDEFIDSNCFDYDDQGNDYRYTKEKIRGLEESIENMYSQHEKLQRNITRTMNNPEQDDFIDNFEVNQYQQSSQPKIKAHTPAKPGSNHNLGYHKFNEGPVKAAKANSNSSKTLVSLNSYQTHQTNHKSNKSSVPNTFFSNATTIDIEHDNYLTSDKTEDKSLNRNRSKRDITPQPELSKKPSLLLEVKDAKTTPSKKRYYEVETTDRKERQERGEKSKDKSKEKTSKGNYIKLRLKQEDLEIDESNIIELPLELKLQGKVTPVLKRQKSNSKLDKY